MPPLTGRRSDLTSQGVRCAADLHLPDGVERPPVVVMGHGLAALRTFGLEPYARRFVEAGIAVLRFDYRGFGDSDGTPRQLVDHRRHLEDWRAALAHVRALDEVDGTRVAVWGSSYGGGHVLRTAARDHELRAAVVQVPFVDGLATLRHLPLGAATSLVPHALRDLGRALTRRAPHTVPVVAHPGEIGAMTTPESHPGYMAIVPPDAPWDNAIPARLMLTLPLYRPTRRVGRIRCPVHVTYAERDSLIPVAAVARVVGRLHHVEAHREPYGHFDVYDGPEFEAAVASQTDFLRRHLGA